MIAHFQEQQFIHLVRLAWDLRGRGRNTALELPNESEPALLVSRVPIPLRVTAIMSRGQWFFTWGRGRDRHVRALTIHAADRVWELTR